MLKASQAYTVLELICEVNISIADSAEAIQSPPCTIRNNNYCTENQKERIKGALILVFLIAGLVLQEYAVFSWRT